MTLLLTSFKLVSLIFAASAVVTGIQAIIDPVGFARFFGLPITATNPKAADKFNANLTLSYISLMGVRQLATGIILLVFAYQGKWTEMATILAIIGIVVAGTDGIYLARSGARRKGVFHAVPGALISLLAGVTLLNGT